MRHGRAPQSSARCAGAGAGAGADLLDGVVHALGVADEVDALAAPVEEEREAEVAVHREGEGVRRGERHLRPSATVKLGACTRGAGCRSWTEDAAVMLHGAGTQIGARYLAVRARHALPLAEVDEARGQRLVLCRSGVLPDWLCVLRGALLAARLLCLPHPAPSTQSDQECSSCWCNPLQVLQRCALPSGYPREAGEHKCVRVRRQRRS